MTFVAGILLDVFKKTVSGFCATYLIRLLDKLMHKNNRQGR